VLQKWRAKQWLKSKLTCAECKTVPAQNHENCARKAVNEFGGDRSRKQEGGTKKMQPPGMETSGIIISGTAPNPVHPATNAEK
jgi:hypothetical protein